MKPATVVVCALVFTGWSPLPAQNVRGDPQVRAALSLLDIWVEAQLDYERIPGISIGVVYDQDLIWSEGYGFADAEGRVPATPRTLYSICSISKLFTSISVMQLRDAGKLRLDDTVAHHLEWFDIEQAHADAGPATVEGLLTHSAGLPRESASPYWSEANFPTRAEVMERLSKQETLYPARTYFQYSNLGMTLAGEIVKAASGMSYDEYVQRHILDPLGMNDTYPDLPEHERFATGYGTFRRDGTRMTVPPYTVNAIAPAAGFASTVEDLARFASWQFRTLDGKPTDVLATNTLREMHRVHWLDPHWRTTWGLGFSVWRDDDKTFVAHGGSCPGFRTQLAMRPQEKFAAVFMTNAQGVNTRAYTDRAYEIVAPAIRAALKSDEEKGRPFPFGKYVGFYERPLGGETAVIEWEGELAMVPLPTANPISAMTRLRHVDGDTFRRVREDDELGEEISFELDASGAVVRFWRNNQYATRRP
jgi:CubicO group peptidase (beta-lactamase class C family)